MLLYPSPCMVGLINPPSRQSKPVYNWGRAQDITPPRVLGHDARPAREEGIPNILFTPLSNGIVRRAAAWTINSLHLGLRGVPQRCGYGDKAYFWIRKGLTRSGLTLSKGGEKVLLQTSGQRRHEEMTPLL
jgi:hypothetical protein